MKEKDKEFYVYAYIRNADDDCCFAGTPYYIGKGKGARKDASKIQVVGSRGTGARDLLPDDPKQIIVLKDGLSEDEALNLEIRLIAFYGRADRGSGCLLNQTDGGEGTTGYQYTEELREKRRNQLIGNTYGRRVDWNDPQVRANHAEGLRRRKPYEMTAARRQQHENLQIPYNWQHNEYGERLGVCCLRMAKETGLHQASFWKVANGRQKQTHGWICLNPTKVFNTKPHDPARNVKAGRTRNQKGAAELGISIEEYEKLSYQQRSYRRKKLRKQKASEQRQVPPSDARN